MRVLLTGATGSVGRLLRPYLAAAYDSVLLNARSAIADLRPNESDEQGDICDPDLVDRLVGRVDGIIHVAALVGPDYQFEEVLGPNVIGVYQVLEAARRHSVRRIVYASSHHAIGFVTRGVHVDHETPPRGDSWYGVSKAFGEILARHAADRYGLDVMSIRIGYVGESIPDERRLHTWCSARDLASLIHIGLTGPQKGFHMVYGISRCPEPLFDNRHAETLGYQPQDSSLDHLSDPSIARQVQDPGNPEQRYIGGYFAARKEP
jgi:uronate dehydrogenase